MTFEERKKGIIAQAPSEEAALSSGHEKQRLLWVYIWSSLTQIEFFFFFFLVLNISLPFKCPGSTHCQDRGLSRGGGNVNNHPYDLTRSWSLHVHGPFSKDQTLI